MPRVNTKTTDTETPKVTGKPIPKSGKVIETKTLRYDVEVGERENSTNNAPLHDTFDNNIPFSFAGIGNNIPKNSLPHLFSVLAEEGEDSYICYVQRRIDVPSDNFLIPCNLSPINFPPFNITAEYSQSFIGMLQKFNSNSGGRFDVVVTTRNNEVIDGALLKDFVVPNPYIERQEQNGNQNTILMMQMFERMQEQQNEKFSQLVENLKPEKSDMDELARELLKRKLLDSDAPREEFNMAKVMEQIFTSTQVVERMSNRMFRDEPIPDEIPPIFKYLESDTGKLIVERGLNTLGQIAMLIATRQQQAMHNQVSQPTQPTNTENPTPPSSNNMYTDTPQTQSTQQISGELTPEQKQTMVNTQNLVIDIIDELETDNPINANNDVLKDLYEEYPAIMPMIQTACKMQDFDSLFSTLETSVPSAFTDFYNGDKTLNARGVKVKNRLQEFYTYMRSI